MGKMKLNLTNIRDLITYWNQKGVMLRIKREVDPLYELGGVISKQDGQPFYFEKVKGYSLPMVAGFGSDRGLLADSMGINEADLIPKLIEAIVDPIPTHRVVEAPVQEKVVLDDIQLDRLFPIGTYNEQDSGPFIVAGVLVVKDMSGKKRYTSIRRMQFLGGNRCGILITSPELKEQYHTYEERNEPMEVAIMMGVVPAVVLGSQISTHWYHADKLNVAGALLGTSLPVVSCKTVDLEVLAEAEIVLEGKMLPHVRELEGPFGELAGYYGVQSPQPVIEITAVTHRNQPICQTILPASFEERLPMGIVRELTLLSSVRQVVPHVKAVHITMAGVARYHGVIQIEKRSEGDGKQACLAAFASDKDLKHVVVVDEDVDPFDPADVEWAIATRVQADLDIFIVPGAKGSPLEPSHNLRGVSAKMGIDATIPLTEKAHYQRKRIPGAEHIRLEDYL